MTAFVALLAGVNVGGNRKVPMGDLREVATELGYTGAATYIQSGNVVLSAKGKSAAIERALEGAIERRFGFSVDVLVRSLADWSSYADANPFDVPGEESRVMLLLSRAAPRPDAAEALLARAKGGEQVRLAGGVLWAYYPKGMGTTKLTPSLVDRLVGSKVTARNWRTVMQLRDMASALG